MTHWWEASHTNTPTTAQTMTKLLQSGPGATHKTEDSKTKGGYQLVRNTWLAMQGTCEIKHNMFSS